jgi:hypothetical protein
MTHAITEVTTDDNIAGQRGPILTPQVASNAAAFDAAAAEYYRLADDESGASPEEVQSALDRLDQIENAYSTRARQEYEAACIQFEMNTDPPPTLKELGELRLASASTKNELKRVRAMYSAGLTIRTPRSNLTRQYIDAEYAEALAEIKYQRAKRLFRERDPAKAERRPTTRLMGRTYTELMQLESPQWLAPQLIPENGFAVLFGKPKSGKTFFALELSICVATGKPFHGLPIKQGRALYLAGEGGPARMRERVTTLLKARGIADHELKDHDGRPAPVGHEGFDQWLMVSSAINLCDPKSVGEFLRLNPGRFELIVIDTLARCMPGGDENATKDMNAAVSGCDRIREKTGAAVLLIHHEGWKEKRPRGASALFGAVDALLRAEMDKTTKIVTVGAEDLRDDQPGSPMSFMLSDGVLTQVAANSSSSASDRREKMLIVLSRLFNEHGPVPSEQWRAACIADGLLDGKNDHMRRQQFRRAMDWMVNHRTVKLTARGLLAPATPADDFEGEE